MNHCHTTNCRRQVNYPGGKCSEHLPERMGINALAVVWTRFTRRRTELQFRSTGLGNSEPIGPPGFATHHRMPVGAVELGTRAYSAL